MSCHLSPLKNKSKNLRKSTNATSHFFIELQLIYINFVDMHIGHIGLQSKHITSISNVTSAHNQHSRGLIARFIPKTMSFNLIHNQPPWFYILTHVF
jgi:hypothetical protein